MARHRGRENNVVGADPEVVADEAILGLHPATQGATIGTAKIATATPTPTAAGLLGEGGGVVAADAIRITNDFTASPSLPPTTLVIAMLISFNAWLSLFYEFIPRFSITTLRIMTDRTKLCNKDLGGLGMVVGLPSLQLV